MENQKFMSGDKVRIVGRAKVYNVVKQNETSGKVQIESEGLRQWVYADWLELYESINFLIKALQYVISLFSKKKI